MKKLRIVNKSAPSSTHATIHSVPITTHNGEKFPCRFYDKPKENLSMDSDVLVENKVFKCLHDTGAGISAMNPKILAKLTTSVHNVSPCTPFKVQVSIDETDQNDHFISSYAEIVITLQKRRILWRFFLAPGLQRDFILGVDFMYAYHITIDVHSQKLKFGVPAFQDPNWMECVPVQHRPKSSSSHSNSNISSFSKTTHMNNENSLNFKFPKPNLVVKKSRNSSPTFDALTSNITTSSASVSDTTTTATSTAPSCNSGGAADKKQILVTRSCRIPPNTMKRIPIFNKVNFDYTKPSIRKYQTYCDW
jgi:hypothetical protein